MGNKKYGLNYERKEKKYWESRGATVLRSRGSFGLFDMIVACQNKWILISVKSSKKAKGYLKHFYEVRDFNNAPIGTLKKLVIYTKGKRMEYDCGTIKEENGSPPMFEYVGL